MTWEEMPHQFEKIEELLVGRGDRDGLANVNGAWRLALCRYMSDTATDSSIKARSCCSEQITAQQRVSIEPLEQVLDSARN